MNRAQILWLECWIALFGGVFWSLPPRLYHWEYILVVSLVWALTCLLSIWVETLENWAHRMSAFFGFLLCTIEGILGLLGLTPKGGLILLSLLHGSTFGLSIAGRYMSRASRRRRPTLEELTREALEQPRE